MYNNIGKKIKGLALTFFIVETLAAIIGAIALIADDDDFIPVGVLMIIVAPFVAWVSSWLLYAFGELVEKTVANESNTRNILKKLTETPPNDFAKATPNTHIDSITNTNTPTHKWRCDSCGNMKRTQTPCEYCGKE